MCMLACACDAIQSLLRLLFLSDRSLVKTEFWHQRPQASAHAPGTKVSLILPLSSPPLSLCLCRHGCLLTVSIPTPFHMDHTACLAPPIRSPSSHPLSLSALLYFTIDLGTPAFICSNCHGRLVFSGKQYSQAAFKVL